MTFQRIDLLPNFDIERKHALQERWGSDQGRDLEEKIIDLIRKGGGEDFLQGEFEAGQLGFLEDQWDLRGLNLFSEHITFPEDDNFENINFAYSEFYHGSLVNACFGNYHLYITHSIWCNPLCQKGLRHERLTQSDLPRRRQSPRVA